MVDNKFKFWRVGQEEINYVTLAIQNGLTGKYTEIFEEKFAELTKSKYAIATNSGTTALASAIWALELEEGDEVIVPALTFTATAFTPLYANAIPVFADVCPKTFLIDPSDIEKKITSRTKAIVTVSLYGLMPDMKRIREIADKHGLKIIEDNAQAILAEAEGVGLGELADFSTYSLQRSKHLTTGDGGVITSNDEVLAKKARKYADLGYSTLEAKSGSHIIDKNELQKPSFKRHDLVGMNFRLPELCSAAGIAQVEKCSSLVQMRQKCASIFKEVTLGFEDLITVQDSPANYNHTWWAFCFTLNTEKVSWDDFRAKFKELGGHNYYGAWSICYLEPALYGKKYRDQDFLEGLCPIAEDIQSRLVQLKTNFETEQEAIDQANILSECLSFFTKS